MDIRGVEIESGHYSTEDLRKNRTESLAHLLAILGIIMTAIEPFLFVFTAYYDPWERFLFDSDIMFVMSYLMYIGPVVFVLGLVLIVRIRMRSFQPRNRTVLPVFGGLLLILGAVYAALAHPLNWLVITLNGGTVGLDPLWLILGLAVIVISIFAGVLALKRRQWSLVLIACSTAFLTASIFGFLAIVPIALSRSEFAHE